MKTSSRVVFWLFAMAMGAAPSRAVEVSPLFNFQVMGGQYFFKDERGGLTGNAQALLAPALRFDERWALLPSLSSSYQGTKQVVDLVGSGSVFQEQMDHRTGLKLVMTPGGPDGRWRLKPSVSAKWELLKETKDEEWTEGLFDYYKLSGGVEAEYLYGDPYSLRFGFDYFQTWFPNYSSLESQAAMTVNGLSRSAELVGDFVLDTRNYSIFASMDGPISDRVILEGSAACVYQDFYNQPVIDDAGQLTAKLREDIYTSVGLGVRLPARLDRRLRLLGSLDVGLAYNSSDQNSFDAQRVKFMGFYYNYSEVKAGPALRFYIGDEEKPVLLSVSGLWTMRHYPHRSQQDDKGTYGTDPVETHSYTASTSLSYPMTEQFSLLFNFQYGESLSNQKYEEYYSYNYTVKNYLFGFKYEY
ncbi:MAG: hypothetical protein HY924_08945 [Elusimicrobia bacterium]|nr:hypothetical protein [Elusimicrobiota bacterium]